MEKLIDRLDNMAMDMRNWQEHLRGTSWPSKALSNLSNDVIIYLAMAANAAERLTALLVPLVPAKPEPEEPAEEEEDGEVPSEPVQEPEGGEASNQVSIQEPETEGSEGD